MTFTTIPRNKHAVLSIHPEDRRAVEEYEAEQRSLLADLDPAELDAYKEAARHFLHQLNAALVFIITRKDMELALWQVAFGYGLAMCEGMSMDAKAKEIGNGYTRAALSKGARDFQRGMALPMSEPMRDSAGSCADARERQLTEATA